MNGKNRFIQNDYNNGNSMNFNNNTPSGSPFMGVNNQQSNPSSLDYQMNNNNNNNRFINANPQMNNNVQMGNNVQMNNNPQMNNGAYVNNNQFINTGMQNTYEPLQGNQNMMDNTMMNQQVVNNPIDNNATGLIGADVSNSNFASNIAPAPAPKKKKDKIIMTGGLGKKIVIALLVIALLVGGAYGAINIFIVNGKNIVKTSIVKAYDSLISVSEKAEKKTLVVDPASERLGVSGDISFSSNFKNTVLDLTKLNKYKISYDAAVDFSNQKMSFAADIMRDKDKLIDIETFINKNIYILGSKTLSEYSYQGELDHELSYEVKSSINYADLRVLINLAKETTLNSIDESKISKSGYERKVGNDTIKCTKVTYKFKYSDLYERILGAYLNDNVSVEILSRLMSSSEDDVRKNLRDAIDDIEESEDMELSVYVDSLRGTFKGLSLGTEDGMFELDLVGNDYQFYVTGVENQVLKGSYLVDSKTLNMHLERDTLKYDISYTEVSDSKSNISLSLDDGIEKITLEFVVDNIVNDTKQTINTDVKVSYITEHETVEFGVDAQINIVKGAEVKENSNIFLMEIDSMTEDDANEIISNFAGIYNIVMSDLISKYAEHGLSLDDVLSSNAFASKNCELSFDCDCDDSGSCSCYYYDTNEELKTVTCPKNYSKTVYS